MVRLDTIIANHNPARGRAPERNPISGAVAAALEAFPGRLAVRVEPACYGARMTDAVVHLDDGSHLSCFTSLTREEFEEMLSDWQRARALPRS